MFKEKNKDTVVGERYAKNIERNGVLYVVITNVANALVKPTTTGLTVPLHNAAHSGSRPVPIIATEPALSGVSASMLGAPDFRITSHEKERINPNFSSGQRKTR